MDCPGNGKAEKVIKEGEDEAPADSGIPEEAIVFLACLPGIGEEKELLNVKLVFPNTPHIHCLREQNLAKGIFKNKFYCVYPRFTTRC